MDQTKRNDRNQKKGEIIRQAVGNGFDYLDMKKKVAESNFDLVSGIIEIFYEDGSAARGRVNLNRVGDDKLSSVDFIKAFLKTTKANAVVRAKAVREKIDVVEELHKEIKLPVL